MATRLGAAALHIGHLTGSLEAGQARRPHRAGRVGRCTAVPAFARDPGGIYARIVYTSKSTDVVDVLCNGRWLMREPHAADRCRRRGDARGRGTRAQHRQLPGQPRSQRAAEAGRGRRRRRAGELRGAGQGPPRHRQPGARGAGRPRADRHPPEPLPPARHLLVVRRPRPGPAALSRRRVPRRRRRR